MIRKTIVCVCLIMLLARCGYGKTIADNNGNDWQEWDESEKLMFAVGFLSGSICVVEWNMVDIQQKLYESKTEKEKKLQNSPDEWQQMKRL